MTDYELIGGDVVLERVVRQFVRRFVDDMIIGYLFVGRDYERIVKHEVEHAAGLLGGPSAYSGRPLTTVHRPLRINKGHFRRRLALVRLILRKNSVDEGIIERWIEADERLIDSITTGQDCLPGV
ncbi:MAG: hemoglobin [Kiritimatiellia bacterium]|jgi:hemoglobin